MIQGFSYLKCFAQARSNNPKILIYILEIYNPRGLQSINSIQNILNFLCFTKKIEFYINI